MVRGGVVYFLTNKNNTVIYVGVTSNLISRMYNHINKINVGSFSSRYNLNKLVYYDSYPTIEEAIVKEKQIKGGSRKIKEELINKVNPNWIDLYPEILKS